MDEFDDMDDLFNLGGDDGDDRDNIDVYKRAQRMMFVNDVERFPSAHMALSLDEFVELFDSPEDEDIAILTQCFITSYMRCNPDNDAEMGNLVGKWGLDWLGLFLAYNQKVEEYELCSIIKEVMDAGQKKLDEWRAEDLLQSIKDQISS
jgi:hypothetical protein